MGRVLCLGVQLDPRSQKGILIPAEATPQGQIGTVLHPIVSILPNDTWHQFDRIPLQGWRVPKKTAVVVQDGGVVGLWATNREDIARANQLSRSPHSHIEEQLEHPWLRSYSVYMLFNKKSRRWSFHTVSNANLNMSRAGGSTIVVLHYVRIGATYTQFSERRDKSICSIRNALLGFVIEHHILIYQTNAHEISNELWQPR